MTTTTGREWHAAEAALLAYAHEESSDVEAWSVETHLVSCRLCRDRVNVAVDGTELAGEIARHKRRIRSSVAPEIPGLTPPAPAIAPTARTASHAGPRPTRRLAVVSRTLLGRTPWFVAITLVTVLTVFLDLLWRQLAPGTTWRLDSIVLLVGPVLPLAGVAFVCSTSTDPCAEVVLSTPSAGLRMVLWRTLSVLVVALPLTVALGATSGSVTAGALLLPTLAMTVGTLALGTRVGLEVAAALVGGGWLVVVALPSLALTRLALPVYAEPALWGWAAVLCAGALATSWQRDGFERLAGFGIRRRGVTR